MSVVIERTKTIELVHKITHDGHEHTSLKLRPPRTGERRKAEGHLRTNQSPENFTLFAVALVASCSGMQPGMIEQMDDDQFMEAWEWVGSFLGAGPKIGS